MRPGLVTKGPAIDSRPDRTFFTPVFELQIVNRLKFAYESLFGQSEPIIQISSESMKRRPLADEIETG